MKYSATIYDICFMYVNNETLEVCDPSGPELFNDFERLHSERKYSFVSYSKILGTVTGKTFKELHEKTLSCFGNQPLGIAIKKL